MGLLGLPGSGVLWGSGVSRVQGPTWSPVVPGHGGVEPPRCPGKGRLVLPGSGVVLGCQVHWLQQDLGKFQSRRGGSVVPRCPGSFPGACWFSLTPVPTLKEPLAPPRRSLTAEVAQGIALAEGQGKCLGREQQSREKSTGTGVPHPTRFKADLGCIPAVLAVKYCTEGTEVSSPWDSGQH